MGKHAFLSASSSHRWLECPPSAKLCAEQEKEYTFTEVRAFLAEKSRAGHTAKIRKILEAHGADKLSALDKEEYAAVMAEAEVLR